MKPLIPEKWLIIRGGREPFAQHIRYLIPCIFFHTANHVLNKGSLNASVG